MNSFLKVIIDNFKGVNHQEIVYLLQRLGLKLGYIFTWTKLGLECENLGRDLHKVLNFPTRPSDTLPRFQKNFLDSIEEIKALIMVDEKVYLNQQDWVRLLVLYDLLRFFSGWTHSDIGEFLLKEPSFIHMYPYLDHASLKIWEVLIK